MRYILKTPYSGHEYMPETQALAEMNILQGKATLKKKKKSHSKNKTT